MEITLQSSENLCRIGVLGHLESAAERDQLQHILDSADQTVQHQIDFYDADTLPPEIIAAIARCLTRLVQIKIITYHYLLTHSLMRLDLPVHPIAVRINKAQAQTKLQIQALALAGSANSLDKILPIIEQLPLGKMAVFVVQHVLENQINLLDTLLRTRTEYKVVMPQNLMPIEPGTIYVAPPGHHMKVAHGLVYLTRDKAVQYARPSIDVLFESLASEYGSQLMAILLCGFGRDGVDGCAKLTNAGACVIIENGAECENARALPDAAIEAGKFNHVLKLPVICSLVAATVYTNDTAITEHQLELFIDALLSHYGYDFRGYQQASFKRRIMHIMMKFELPNLLDFERAIFSDSTLFNRMMAEISVGVSTFFRHPEQFLLLREKIFPYLESFPVIKLWSAGCATGEEPYSLAILLEELGLLKRSRLFATDFNAYLIDIAKAGLFPQKSLETSQQNYEKSGGKNNFFSFIEQGSHYLTVKDSIRSTTLFHRHSLVDEGIFNEFQFIICRNVMIYFKPELQSKILERFARSLHRDGFLVLGPQDGMHHLARSAGFVPYITGSHVYRLGNGGLHG
ncbi:CheR family methyltransferase [Solimicrobium silvestre]|uniref:CheB methylesterase n=1 Tax=Solimicrobium silvestre TaxID=2099400 RepID=A0A2S9GTQ7_9BURK|nr:CheR family methyltransferase [Solimicrobium silvestre]PRC91100.1 CheB methylesterase [Solimicrobium silvestre]